MSYFPVFIQLEDKKCVIVGGGQVAYGKAISLLEAGARVTVVAPDIHHKFTELEKNEKKQLQVLNRIFREDDFKNAALVIAATNRTEINQQVVDLCETKGIMVNSASHSSKQGVGFSSFMRRGPITIAISSGGTSPLLAKYLRDSIENQIPDYIEKVAMNLEKYRAYIIQKIENQQQRKEIFSILLQMSIEQEGVLCSEDVENVVINLRGGKAYDENQNRNQKKQTSVGTDPISG